MEVDPYCIHAFWEVTPRERKAAARELAREDTSPPWVLRLYNAADRNAFFDTPIDLITGNWYVRRTFAETAYFAEIGPRSASGRFRPVAQSNIVLLPCNRPSAH